MEYLQKEIINIIKGIKDVKQLRYILTWLKLSIIYYSSEEENR